MDQVMQRAREVGVRAVLMPNIDTSSIEDMHRTVDAWPDMAYPMMGLHPCSVNPESYKSELEEVKRHLFQPVRKYWAVGEIGLDLYWDQSTLEIQKEAFKAQIEWAKALNLPIVIHVRDAFDETFELVDELHDERLRGVFHCFTGTKEQAQHIIDYGSFKMGIGGVLTFKNGKIDQFIHEIEPAHLMLETDSPYLAPTPNRGKRNEPSYTALILKKLAACYDRREDELASILFNNTIELFDLNLRNDEMDTDYHPDWMDD